MTTTISSFSPSSGERNLDFIATTEGECVPSIATMEVNQRERTTTFICIPESTNSSIATLTVSQRNRTDIEFIALSLECEFTPVLGFDCSPMKMTLPGVANFGDFKLEGTKTTTYNHSYTERDSISFTSLSETTTWTYHYLAQRNRFYNPDEGYTSPGSYSSSNDYERSTVYTTWWMDEPEETDTTLTESYDGSGSLTKSYKRQEATLVCDTTWYPITYNSHFRYIASGGETRASRSYTGISVAHYLNTHDWRDWKFRSLNARLADANRDAGLRDETFYNGTQFVTITDPDTEEVKVLPIEFKMSPYDINHYQSPWWQTDTSIEGALSPIPQYTRVYGSESDTTYKGRPIDLGKIPVPCSFVADAIIKLDGVEPKTVLPTYVVPSINYVNSNYVLEELNRFGYHEDRGGHTWDHILASLNMSSTDYLGDPKIFTDIHYGASYSKISLKSYTEAYSDWIDYCLPDNSCRDSFSSSTSDIDTLTGSPDFTGIYDYGHRGVEDLTFSKVVNYQRLWKFCLQLGPIFRKVYDQKILGSNYTKTEFRKEYIGFGWGVYLIGFGDRDISANSNYVDGVSEIEGPFSYTTHLSEYFEYSEDQDSRYDSAGLSTIARGWGIRMKDIDFDEETIVKALEDFSKTPDQLEFTKSDHSPGGGIINNVVMYPTGDGYTRDCEVNTYNDNWIGLNPFGVPTFESEPHPYKNKKPPEEFGLQKVWIFDKRHTLIGNSNLDELEELFEDHPYLNSLMVGSGRIPSLDGLNHTPYVELNWSHETESYIFSINDDHTDWIRDFYLNEISHNEYGDVTEALFSFPYDRYKMPTGELILGEIVSDEEGTFLPLSFNWSSYPRYFNDYDGSDNTSEDVRELYRSPFYGHPTSVSGIGSVKIPNKGDIWAVEFAAAEYLCISNVNPNHYSHWATKKEIRDDDPESDPEKEIRYNLIPTYFDYD